MVVKEFKENLKEVHGQQQKVLENDINEIINQTITEEMSPKIPQEFVEDDKLSENIHILQKKKIRSIIHNLERKNMNFQNHIKELEGESKQMDEEIMKLTQCKLFIT